MAIVTLCPQCQTAFAIQAEHYSAADAWVRCGRCAHVFELDQHLFELDEQVPPPPVAKPEVVRPRPPKNPPIKPKPMPSWIWNSSALLLVLLLVFQMLLHQRHQIRGLAPELSPWFTSICESMSCDLHWPMQPDKVSMESGSFKHLGGNDYAFEGVIKNRSEMHISPPALELSLTDDIDMPVIRKVISAEDLGLPDPLRQHRAQSFEVRFALDPDVSSKINGYRAFLFYP